MNQRIGYARVSTDDQHLDLPAARRAQTSWIRRDLWRSCQRQERGTSL